MRYLSDAEIEAALSKVELAPILEMFTLEEVCAELGIDLDAD